MYQNVGKITSCFSLRMKTRSLLCCKLAKANKQYRGQEKGKAKCCTTSTPPVAMRIAILNRHWNCMESMEANNLLCDDCWSGIDKFIDKIQSQKN